MTMNAYPSPLYAILCSSKDGCTEIQTAKGRKQINSNRDDDDNIMYIETVPFKFNDNQQQQVEDKEMKTSFVMKARIERQQERIILRICPHIEEDEYNNRGQEMMNDKMIVDFGERRAKKSRTN